MNKRVCNRRPVFLLTLGLLVGMAACAGRPGVSRQAALEFAEVSAGAEISGRSGSQATSAKVYVQDSAGIARSETARRLEAAGYVNIAALDMTIAVHLVYATPDNFTGKVLYRDLTQAYLHPDAAKKLVKAQHLLKAAHPELSLIVYDAARPISVQREMWKLVVGTPQNIYVSNPSKGGGLHNYGMAADVTLVDAAGTPLPMGTPFDWFGSEAHIDREEELVVGGKITAVERENRLLLRRVMREAGFQTFLPEWWHFNAVSLDEARERYRVIE